MYRGNHNSSKLSGGDQSLSIPTRNYSYNYNHNLIKKNVYGKGAYMNVSSELDI